MKFNICQHSIPPPHRRRRWDLRRGGGLPGPYRKPSLGPKKTFPTGKKKIASADFFFWGSPRGPPKFCQKPSFEIQANLCKVLFHFHSKLRLGPKSGFRKIDFSTTKRPLNIFLSIRNDSLADQTPIKRVISKTTFSRFLDTLTLFGRFEISTPQKHLQKWHF